MPARDDLRIRVRQALAPYVSLSPSEQVSLLGGLVTGSVYGFVGEKLSELSGCVCVIGAFDGMHLGHRALLESAKDQARLRGTCLVALTFSPDPSDILYGQSPASVLLPVEYRPHALMDAGADVVIVLDFTPEFAAIPHDHFVREVLWPLLFPSTIVVGRDFRLGDKGKGTVSALAEDGRALGINVIGEVLATDDGQPITATRVRSLVREGEVERAGSLLGRSLTLWGRVVHGRGQGSALGIPTANVSCDALFCAPASGVYAGFVVVCDLAWPAVMNVGRPPTFDDCQDLGPKTTLIEANLIGFKGNLYGFEVAVVLLTKLRDSRRFESVDELVRAILDNMSWVGVNLVDRPIEIGGGAA